MLRLSSKKVDLSNDKFVVIGAGETGKSIISYLNYHNACILRVMDTRSNPPVIDGVEIIGGKLEYTNIIDADVVIISPGISIYEPVLQRAITEGKRIIGDIELFAQAISSWSTKVIGITGSNGKTTVTSLTGFLAQRSGIKTLIAGNIGTPVLDALREIELSHDYPQLIVLELSSFQLETTVSLSLASGIVLNISEDHLDRYTDLLEYAYAKAQIFRNCQRQVLNSDDPLVMAMIQHQKLPLFFAEDEAEYSLKKFNDKLCLSVNHQNYLACDDLQLLGRHNYLNVLASIALLAGAGYDIEQFKNALKEFSGLEHRMQKVLEHEGVLYIEDSKGTNVGAVLAGVSGIDRRIHLILGGDGKGQDFAPLRKLVQDKCASVALIGQDADLIAKVLDGIPNVNKFRTLQEAVSSLIHQAKKGDAVILSPACASWDMFTNYKERAQVFIDSIYANIK